MEERSQPAATSPSRVSDGVPCMAAVLRCFFLCVSLAGLAAAEAARSKKGGSQQAPVVARAAGTIAAGGMSDADSFGDLIRVQSSFEDHRAWADVASLDESLIGQKVWVRARLHVARGKGKTAFLVLRRGFSTVQAVVEEGVCGMSKDGVKYASKIPSESIVDVYGEVVAAAEEVKSTSQSKVEIQVQKVFGVSIGATSLPFQLEDAARPEPKEGAAPAASSAAESKEDADGKKKKVQTDITVGQDLRLNNRWIDVRTPANHAIFRLQSRVCQYYRNFFLDQDFVEIHTPKLTPGVSEGGASVFRLKYLNGVNACLAQSPQLYKQMAVTSDLTKVFEIGPVFRAEDSNTSATHSHTHCCVLVVARLLLVLTPVVCLFCVSCCLLFAQSPSHVRVCWHGFRDGDQAALPRGAGRAGRLLRHHLRPDQQELPEGAGGRQRAVRVRASQVPTAGTDPRHPLPGRHQDAAGGRNQDRRVRRLQVSTAYTHMHALLAHPSRTSSLPPSFPLMICDKF